MDLTSELLDDGVAVVRIDGRLNMVTATKLRDGVIALVDSGHNRVAVDLSRVEFMDSSGLGALISGLKTTRLAGGDLRIAAPTEQVGLVLRLTNMDHVLTAYSSADRAFSS